MADSLASTSDAELRAHLKRTLEGQYDLEHELGRGGMGVVFKARDRRLKRAVAVKVLPPELAFRGEIRTRFLREAETAAQLTHPNIVPIYTVDEKDGLVFFVMAYVDGDNLARRIHERGAMDAGEARRVLRAVAEAMAYAHDRNVIHRDIKPDNILLDAASGRPMVTDFGIARAISEGADARLTATGIAIGTPAYMSPEQSASDKEIDGRSDLYSLGVVAYQMLSGELPFTASNTPAMLVKHLSEQPMPLTLRRPDVPPDLAAVVMCLLEKNPEDRFAAAKDLISAIDGDGPVPAPRSAALRPAPTWSPVPATPPQPMQAEDWMRWSAPVVKDFRRRIFPYIIVNVVIVAFSIFTSTNLTFITAIWGVFLAFRYAKLWSEGYDWRDVFRQPRDRLFFDVVSEALDDVRALFDKDKRAEVRARWHARRGKPGLNTPPGGALPGSSAMTDGEFSYLGNARVDAVRRAEQDRDEIVQLIASLPDREKKRLRDVGGTARSLAERVRSMAFSLAELDRTLPPGGAIAVDREVSRLEGQANPLDREASEARVRRLALLKRDRRGAADRERRRDEMQARLESCTLALQNLRFDVLRLKTGASTTENVTLLAERAMTLARDVDDALGGDASASSGPR